MSLSVCICVCVMQDALKLLKQVSTAMKVASMRLVETGFEESMQVCVCVHICGCVGVGVTWYVYVCVYVCFTLCV